MGRKHAGLVALWLLAGSGVLAFHDGGVGECVGCHTVHTPFASGGNPPSAGDTTAVCLACHEQRTANGPSSFLVSTPESELPPGVSPIQRTPGGDFGWLRKTYTWEGEAGGVEVEEGHSHGHSIYDVDPVNAVAPGGTYPSAALGCASCHDPHATSRRNVDGSISGPTGARSIGGSGSYDDSPPPGADASVGVYRMLAGPGYTTGGVTFAGAPDAVAPRGYNQSEATNQVAVAYGRATGNGHVTWAQWCGTCHGAMHVGAASGTMHPADELLGATIAGNYNAYVRTGDLTGSPATSFSSLVPFVHGTADYDAAGTGLKALAGSTRPTYPGPAPNDRVDCLSCHRAHASGFEYAMRWSTRYEFLTDGAGHYFSAGFAARGRSAAEIEDAYYDRPPTVFARAQRTLCNKCHVKD